MSANTLSVTDFTPQEVGQIVAANAAGFSAFGSAIQPGTVRIRKVTFDNDFEISTADGLQETVVPNTIFTTSFTATTRTPADTLIRSSDFTTAMQVGDSLIPVGIFTCDNLLVAKRSEYDEGRINIFPLSEFVVDALPDEVLLTRAVSHAEAEKYRNGDTSLGGRRQHLWHDIIHTAIHNVTSDFLPEWGYDKVVKFLIPKLELMRHVLKGNAVAGPYDYQYAHRDPESPFPFDTELRLNLETIPMLMRGYATWVERSGVDSEPFTAATDRF